MNPQLQRFLNASGFKLLALARLSDCEYSIVLYLLNCTVSGLDQIVTTESELASLIGYSEEELQETVQNLKNKNIIRLKFGENAHLESNPSLRVGLQFDTTRWVLAYEEKATHNDAIVFPFRRLGEARLALLDGEKSRSPRTRESDEDDRTWKRVLESYLQYTNADEDEVEQAAHSARVLVETHPVDQVLLMIRHFGSRIPTLSLLASSWQHYQEIFENETQKVDMLGARQKHHELDQKVRDGAKSLLDKEDELELNEEETTVLRILLKHRHPRRQLFWAYQVRTRYPHLESFFSDHASLMLAVTSGGTVVKKGPEL